MADSCSGMNSCFGFGGRLSRLTNNLLDCWVLMRREANQEVTRKTLSDAGRLGAWRRWHREQAIVALLPMVDRIALRVKWMFSPCIDLRDLKQAGTVGLVKAANAFHPALASAAGFEPYAYFRTRGAIIDSQKRRAYREEQNLALSHVTRRCGVELAGERTLLDTLAHPAPLVDEVLEREEIHRVLQAAIADLPALEREALRGQLAGQALAVTAAQMGHSVTWTRAKLAEARALVGVAVRGE